MRRTIASTVLGIVLGIALVLACSDDSPSTADAAACDCPESSFADRIVAGESGEVTIGPGAIESIGSGCIAPGQILLTGSCRLGDLPTAADLVLMESAVVFHNGTPVEAGWVCRWKNTGGQTTTGVAEAICLNPPAASP